MLLRPLLLHLLLFHNILIRRSWLRMFEMPTPTTTLTTFKIKININKTKIIIIIINTNTINTTSSNKRDQHPLTEKEVEIQLFLLLMLVMSVELAQLLQLLLQPRFISKVTIVSQTTLLMLQFSLIFRCNT